MAKKICQNLVLNNIDIIYCSPLLRAINTVKYLAGEKKIDINLVADLRERKYGSVKEDLSLYRKQQWEDFNYKTVDGESLNEVQNRSVSALMEIVRNNIGKTILICGHAMSGSTSLHYLDPNFNFNDFEKMDYCGILKLEFEDMKFVNLNNIN